MAKKNFMDGLDRVITNNKPGETAAEVTPKEEIADKAAEVKKEKSVSKVASDPKPRKPRKKAEEGKDYVVFTARVTPEAAEFIRNYAFTKRLSIQKAIDDIVFDYKNRYEKNPKNEKLIEKDR